MIRNQKTVDPSDKSSPAVYQLETAMGAAIEVFEGARALRVPRTRFAPVKTTDDLLALRSDAYELTDDARVVLADGRTDAPFVALDPEHYKLLRDFEERFPAGPPSLVECDRFEVEGDVHFGAGVVARGDVVVHGPARRSRTGPSSEPSGAAGDRRDENEHQREDQADPDPHATAVTSTARPYRD